MRKHTGTTHSIVRRLFRFYHVQAITQQSYNFNNLKNGQQFVRCGEGAVGEEEGLHVRRIYDKIEE